MTRIKWIPVLAAVLVLGLSVSATAGSNVSGGSNHASTELSKRLGDPKDCSDFKSQRRAQRWFHNHSPHSDPAGLDSDHDGWACETNPPPKAHHRW